MLVHEVGGALQAGKRRMALVHVDDLGLELERLQGADAADAEQVFLAHARFQVAAVEAVGELARAGLILGHIGVQEIERHAADLRLPDLRVNAFAAQIHVNEDALATVVFAKRQGHLLEVVDRVAFLLPAVGREVLAEIALLVAQADADQGHAEVAGRLEVVAGEDAKPPGIHGQAGADAVFQAEIGHDGLAVAVGKGNRGGLARQVGRKRLAQVAYPLHEEVVLGQGLQGLLGQAVEEAHRVAGALPPQFAVDLGKKRRDVVVPREKQIVGQLPKRFELGRQLRHNAVNA